MHETVKPVTVINAKLCVQIISLMSVQIQRKGWQEDVSKRRQILKKEKSIVKPVIKNTERKGRTRKKAERKVGTREDAKRKRRRAEEKREEV